MDSLLLLERLESLDALLIQAPGEAVRWDRRPAGPGLDRRDAGPTQDRPTQDRTRSAGACIRASSSRYLPCKRVVDFLLAAGLLILSSPILFLIAVSMKLTSRGSIFCAQTRLGLRGRPYKLYKFRTMGHRSEKFVAERWTSAHGPRPTRLGRMLRRAHVDALPQLWNVLRGDMSLIGPRSERPEFVPSLEHALPGYGGRLLVRPGLIGLAQVQLPADTDLESVRRKLACDLFYVQHCGPWLDLQILLSALCPLLGMALAMPRGLLHEPATREVERTQAMPSQDQAASQQLLPV